MLALCPTTYMWLDFSYTTTFSMPFMALICYLASKIYKQKDVNYVRLIVLGVVMGIGGALRITAMILVIAFLLTCIVASVPLKVKWKNMLIPVVVALGMFFIVNSVIVPHHRMDPDRNTYFPLAHWVMMGLEGDGYVNGKDISFTISQGTTEEMSKADIQEIKKRIQKKSPLEIAVHFIKKDVIMWALGKDGFHSSASFGDSMGGFQRWLKGDRDLIFQLFCQAYRAMMMIWIVTIHSSAVHSNKMHTNAPFGHIWRTAAPDFLAKNARKYLAENRL